MYSLIIVDDEVYIANKTKSSVNWEELGIHSVYVVNNIRQAKECFEKHPIDIMICDIEMPQGSGLELLAWVRELYPKTETIFLTCHAEFEYSIKALQLGSLDYLLKPAPSDHLRGVVSKAITKINKERPAIIEAFWQDILQQNISSNPEKVHETLVQQNIPYSVTMQFLPILIGVQRWNKKLTIREENLMEYALRKTAEELVMSGRNSGQMIIQVKKGYILVILQMDEVTGVNSQRLRADLESFIEACYQYFYCELSCYIGEKVTIPHMLNMFERLLFLHHNNVSQSRTIISSKESNIKNERIPLPQMNVWSEMLKQMDNQKLLAETTAFLESWKQIEGLDVKKLQQFYQAFLQMLLSTLQYNGLHADQILSEHLLPERALTATRTVTDLQIWVKEVLETVFNHMNDEGGTQSVVDKVKQYITSHIDEALSRQYIADHVGLSPDYIVKLFKKETGLSITEYIVQERIRISEELLVKSNLPVSSIALAVGYTNFSYFSTIFKKEVMMTPQEYRKKYQK